MDELAHFRHQTRRWLEENCPASMRTVSTIEDMVYGGKKASFSNPDARIWLDRMIDKGWTVPDWPKEYGGAGLSPAEKKILREEMSALHCRRPLVGHGIWMLGPALLQFGNEQQKRSHLPPIARGEIRWCQGYSEPNAGSDLASLRCKAEDMGDYFLVNGSKTWTTDADKADWIFCLVRTDFTVKKQAGISFLLIDMASPGISVKPIRLISGDCHFCETFFDNVKVPKENLVGEINQGWTIAKGLLEHERAMMSDMQAFVPRAPITLESSAMEAMNRPGICPGEKYLLRDRLASLQMDGQAIALTQQRVFDETKAGIPSATPFTLKFLGTEYDKRREETMIELMGSNGLGWSDGFSAAQVNATRSFLLSKAVSIGGGTSEIQLNIIAKHVLGLPE